MEQIHDNGVTLSGRLTLIGVDHLSHVNQKETKKKERKRLERLYKNSNPDLDLLLYTVDGGKIGKDV